MLSPTAVVVPEMLPAGQGFVPPPRKTIGCERAPNTCFVSVVVALLLSSSEACFRAPGLPLPLGASLWTPLIS